MEELYQKRKEFAKSVFGISFPIAVATFITYYYQNFPPFYIPIFFSTVAIISFVYLVKQKGIEIFFWHRKQVKLLKNPKIGILKVDGCESRCTRFGPEEWKRRIDNKFHTAFIENPSDIGREYTAIINPYGEVYPEESIINLTTFHKILQFVADGGTFVCAGGYAFFYAFHIETNRINPLTEPTKGYKGALMKSGEIILNQPILMMGGYSLVDTLLKKHFNLWTTLSAPMVIKTFQNDNDKKYAGNLENVGGTQYVEEFRAIREPAGETIPLLRAKVNGNELYPIAAIPYKRGYLIVAGNNLSSDKSESGNSLADAGFKKVVKAIVQFLEYQKSSV